MNRSLVKLIGEPIFSCGEDRYLQKAWRGGKRTEERTKLLTVLLQDRLDKLDSSGSFSIYFA